MPKFKEQKRESIKAAEKKGQDAAMQGEQRISELQYVKSLTDSILAESRDEDTVAQVRALEQQYRDAGREAYRNEVESVVNSARGELEENKSDIADERSRTETSISRIGDMRGATDLARSGASSAESSLQRSADEFRSMESTTDSIVSQQESQSQNIRSRIESIFS